MKKSTKSVSFILSLLVIVSSLFCFHTETYAASYKTVNGNYHYSYAGEVLKILNEERKAYGLKELVMTEDLTNGAMLRAAETTVSFSHTRPNGEQCFTAFNWSRAAGENIAYGQRSPQQVMNSWMNSSGHRANILNSNYTTVGIGCFEYNGILYWAQAFSGGSGSSFSKDGKESVSVDVSLTTGVASKVKKTETTSSSNEKETTTKQSQPTSERTTNQTTTKKETTTKHETTTKRETTTEKKTTLPSTTKNSQTCTTNNADTCTTKNANTKQNCTTKQFCISFAGKKFCSNLLCLLKK